MMTVKYPALKLDPGTRVYCKLSTAMSICTVNPSPIEDNKLHAASDGNPISAPPDQRNFAVVARARS